jgi:hypothetical protein
VNTDLRLIQLQRNKYEINTHYKCIVGSRWINLFLTKYIMTVEKMHGSLNKLMKELRSIGSHSILLDTWFFTFRQTWRSRTLKRLFSELTHELVLLSQKLLALEWNSFTMNIQKLFQMAACADTFLSVCRLNNGIQFHCNRVSVPFLQDKREALVDSYLECDIREFHSDTIKWTLLKFYISCTECHSQVQF